MHTVLASRLRVIKSAKEKLPSAELGSKVSKQTSELVVGISGCEGAESPRPSTSKGIEIISTDLVSGKIGRQIHPQIESHHPSPFLNHRGSSSSSTYKQELLSTIDSLELKRDSLTVISSAENVEGSVKRDEALLFIEDEPNLWCRHSTEECFSTCVTVDFFIATLKSAWIAIVLLLYFKTPYISPTSGSVLDSIIDENSRPNNTLLMCETIYKLNYEQKKPVLISILILGFPILPLELYLAKIIFYAIEMRNRKKCIIWLVLRVFLSLMFVVQSTFKLMCFTFENFDMATIPEIMYRFFEVNVAMRFIDQVKRGLPLPAPVYKRKVSFQPSHQSFVF